MLKVGQFERSTQTTSTRSGPFRVRITANDERIGRGGSPHTAFRTTLQILPRVAWVCH